MPFGLRTTELVIIVQMHVATQCTARNALLGVVRAVYTLCHVDGHMQPRHPNRVPKRGFGWDVVRGELVPDRLPQGRVPDNALASCTQQVVLELLAQRGQLDWTPSPPLRL